MKKKKLSIETVVPRMQWKESDRIIDRGAVSLKYVRALQSYNVYLALLEICYIASVLKLILFEKRIFSHYYSKGTPLFEQSATAICRTRLADIENTNKINISPYNSTLRFLKKF